MSLLDQGHNNLFAFRTRVLVQIALQTAGMARFVDAVLEADGIEIGTSSFIPATDVAPRAYWCLSGDRKLYVFVSGVETIPQGRALWDAYVNTPVRNSSNVNTWYEAAASMILSNAFPFVETVGQIFLCGYSAGGGVLLEMLRTWNMQFGNRPNVQMITIGSPKPCQPRLLRAMAPSSGSAWFNSDDAVPLIPPEISTYQRIMAGLTLWQGQNIADYVGWPGGADIDLAGRVTGRTGPSGSPLPATEQIGNWLKAQEAGFQTPHSLTTYLARATAAIALRPPSRQLVTPIVPAPALQRESVAVINRAIASTVQTQFYDASRMNGVPVIIPKQKLFEPKRKGKVWHVDFGGVTVAVAPRKRRARALARMGNDFLRRLQNEGVVYSDDLASQFSLYLQAAADPNSGITPTMNTQTS